jgi:hypothetical protein
MKAHNIPDGWRPAHQSETIKRCSCSECYSLDGWIELERCGTQETFDLDGAPYLELRNCKKQGCRTTLAIAMSENMLPLMELRRP